MRRTKTSIRTAPVGSIWDEWVAAFLLEERDAKGRRTRTLQLHRENLDSMRRVLDETGAPADPAELTRAHVVAAVVRLRERGRQARTINLKLQSLSQLFAYAAAEGRCKENPVAAVPRQREAEKPPKALHDDELAKLLRQPDVATFVGLRDRVLMLLLLDTGVRLSEVIRLRLDDVDLPHRTVRVSEESKTHAERYVYVSAGTADELRTYIKERGALATDVLFVNRDERPLARNSVQRSLAAYGRAIGVRVSPHRLRHSFARMYLANGGDPLSLQQILGHADLGMVKRYARLWGSDLQRLHARFSPLRRLGLDERHVP